jgi:protein arginine kinase activator
VKCQHCGSAATVHLVDIVNKQKRELHLCEACAKQQNLLNEPKQDLNLPAILQLLVGQAVAPVTPAQARLTCPACGLKYTEFRNKGRLGCPADYDAFRESLEPILAKIHRSTRHVGKTPRNLARHVNRRADLMELNKSLKAALAVEDYESAARLRDLIREKEATDEPG